MAGDIARDAGRRMKARRDELGLTQPQVAAEIKKLLPEMAIDKQRVSDWERGYNFPSDRYKPAIATVLQVTEFGGFGYFLLNDESPASERTPDPFPDTTEAATLKRIEDRLASIERLLEIFTGTDSEAAGADLADQITVDQAANILRNSTRLMERVAARLGQSIGKRDLESRRATDPPDEAPEVAA